MFCKILNSQKRICENLTFFSVYLFLELYVVTKIHAKKGIHFYFLLFTLHYKNVLLNKNLLTCISRNLLDVLTHAQAGETKGKGYILFSYVLFFLFSCYRYLSYHTLRTSFDSCFKNQGNPHYKSVCFK